MGYRIKDRRTELRMTQEELSEKSGVSRQTISTLETNNDYSVSTKTLSRIAKALNTTVASLFFENSN